MYTNYAYGVGNGLAGQPNSNYNFLITGTSDYTGSTSLMLKNNTTLGTSGNKGTRFTQDNVDNSYLDFRTTAIDGSNSFNFRMIDDSNISSTSNLLTLNKDSLSSTSVYGAKVSGRVKASQYYVNQPDTRTPITAGIYLGQDNNTIAYFKINQGTGTGGYNFVTTDQNGLNPITNLSLKPTGVAQIPYYSQTADPQDTETTALVMWDMQGKMVRGYNQNQRVRGVESAVNQLEGTVYASIPIKVNEVIGRLNTLKIWNSKLSTLTMPVPPTAFTPSPNTQGVVQIQLALSVSLTTAQDLTWQQNFINTVATNLGISPSRIVISAVSGTATVYTLTREHQSIPIQYAYKSAKAGDTYINIIINPDPSSPITSFIAASNIIEQATDGASSLYQAINAVLGGIIDTGYQGLQKALTTTPAPTTPAPTTPAPTTPAPTTPAPTTPAPTTLPPPLYSFTDFGFTPNGAKGSTGPTSLTYNTTLYPWVTNYISLSGGIQRWTVPVSGMYKLIAAGAMGGAGNNTINTVNTPIMGGYGQIVSNNVSLTKNSTIYIITGQVGADSLSNGFASGGGGGATYIVQYNGGSTTSSSSYTILLIAGGGGAGGNLGPGAAAVSTTTGGVNTVGYYPTAATGGNGGNSTYGSNYLGPGGGGFLTDGNAGPDTGSSPGKSFLNGSAGGSTSYNGGVGGFGGGGGSGGNANWGGGGGGGYSGGAGSSVNSATWVYIDYGAGGGGSYDINGINNNATSIGYNAGDGYAIVSLSTYNPSNTISNGLIYYYTFNPSNVSGSSLADLSTGSAVYNTTLYGSPSITTPLFTPHNGAGVITLNASSSQYVGVPALTINPSWTGFSFACWFKIPSGPTQWERIFDFSDTLKGSGSITAGTGYSFLIGVNSNGTLVYTLSSQTSSTSTGANYSTSVNVCNGSWNHVAWSMNSTGWSFYVNGSIVANTYSPPVYVPPVTSVTYNGSTITNYPYAYIGRSTWVSDPYFTGQLSDIRFYNRPITPAEAFYLYNTIPSTNYSIVTNGLAMYLDAGNTNSYSGSGSIWKDMVNGMVFNLQNGPTYSSGNGGYLSFVASSSQWAQSATNPVFNCSNWTVEAWYYAGSNSGQCPAILCQAYNANNINYCIAPVTDLSGFQAAYYSNPNTTWYASAAYALTTNAWYHVVATYDGSYLRLYVNGTLQKTGTGGGTSATGSNYVNLMKRWDNPDYCGGRLAVARIYNTSLNSSQINSNFNAERSRFGL